MLLDALIKLKTLDETLSFRRSCREGICGSDGMNINGKNGLACLINMNTLPKKIVVRPLPGLPVIRDLVVDMACSTTSTRRCSRILINDTPAPATERLQSQEDREKLDGLYECILCACCSTSCPSFWWNPDKFLGPSALMQAYRFLASTAVTRQQPSVWPVWTIRSVFPLPWHHELRQRLPEGAEPDQGDRSYPQHAAEPGHLMHAAHDWHPERPG
jgi:succinate dehydrogenase / fumarate reductase iron-sulfur subunit